jgi:hypothetical protein
MLNQETIDRIEKEADKYAAKYLTTDKRYLAIEVYKDVATAEATRALEREKVLVEALFWIDAYTQDELIKQYIEVKLASYRGEKEVGNG